MSRYDFLRKTSVFVSNTDNLQVQMYDILNVRWQDFNFTNGFKEYVINKNDAAKPWLICNTHKIPYIYEDILFIINGIKNPLEDIIPGRVFKIPQVKDLETFVNSIKQ